jgi:transposase
MNLMNFSWFCDSLAAVAAARMRKMSGEFWLNDEAWAAIDALLPKTYSGARRKDDRQVISGIIHVLRSGCRWKDCPSIYGPYTTIYNRFNRWSGRNRWQAIYAALVTTMPNDVRAIDSTSIKVQRAAAGGKGGLKRRRLAVHGAVARQKSTS